MQSTLEKKSERRKRLMALSYEEKVSIVEQMRAALPQMRAATKAVISRTGPLPSIKSDSEQFSHWTAP